MKLSGRILLFESVLISRHFVVTLRKRRDEVMFSQLILSWEGWRILAESVLITWLRFYG